MLRIYQLTREPKSLPRCIHNQQLYDKRPKDYAKVVTMLAQGATITSITKPVKFQPILLPLSNLGNRKP